MSYMPRTAAFAKRVHFGATGSRADEALHFASQLERELEAALVHAGKETGRAEAAARPEVGAMTAAIKVLEDAEELLPLAHEANIGVAWAIQTLYDHRKRLETSSPRNTMLNDMHVQQQKDEESDVSDMNSSRQE